ncbi:MAG: glycoside hydrolase family 3 C-terminal domain-containing protein, partial [Planctomycetes bacterium]|nr:glycoside hydrolase family 3 C-terminal domain-containing protein [Planctomycetota bacterium]
SEELVRAAAAVTAQDVRASGIPWNFAPVVDVARTPLWSRFYETYGEDVHLASRMGAAAVRGMQGDDPSKPVRVGACLKHFVGYGFPLSGKDRTAAWIPERMMRELFLPPFAAGIEAGAVSVMVNSGEVNGVPVHSSRRLLSTVLRKELGFEGVVVTDWEDVKKLRDMHRVAPTYAEAARMAVRAGVDLCMVPLDYSFTDAVIKLVRDGELDESRIDRSVLRILRMKRQLGLFDPVPAAPAPALSGAEAHALSLRAARESLVLLKNEGALPLGGGRVLLTGPGAVSLPMLHGSWTWTWQGTDPAAYPKGIPTVLEALRGALGADRVTHVSGCTVDSEGDMDAVRASASAADVLVAVIGEEPTVEKPGDIEDLALSAPQVGLVRALIDTGKPVILVLLQGRPRLLDGIADGVAAIVHAGFPGPYGSQAIADVLTGRFNPCGRLPFTYPRQSGSLVPYDHKESARFDKGFGKNAFNPQFPFGHGLSYVRFAYEDLKVEGAPLTATGKLAVSVTVKNEGMRAGRHVILLFVRDEYATITPPVQRLRGFQSVTLDPGAQQRVSWTLGANDLAFVDRKLKWKAEPGAFSVRVGGLTQGFELR